VITAHGIKGYANGFPHQMFNSLKGLSLSKAKYSNRNGQ
jgi:hypothetical protein